MHKNCNKSQKARRYRCQVRLLKIETNLPLPVIKQYRVHPNGASVCMFVCIYMYVCVCVCVYACMPVSTCVQARV